MIEIPSKYTPVKKDGREFAGVLRTCRRHKGTKTTDFVNKYHKRKAVWANKIAYLAGLVDGEGYLKVEKWGTIGLVIGMTDRSTIKWIYDNFGGNFNKQKCQSGKPFYVWRMNQGRDLFYLLLLLIPFLVTKKKELTKALQSLIDKFAKLEHTLKNYKAER